MKCDRNPMLGGGAFCGLPDVSGHRKNAFHGSDQTVDRDRDASPEDCPDDPDVAALDVFDFPDVSGKKLRYSEGIHCRPLPHKVEGNTATVSNRLLLNLRSTGEIRSRTGVSFWERPSHSSCGGVESRHALNVRPGGTVGDGLPDARVVKSDGAVFVASGFVTQAGVAPGPQDSFHVFQENSQTQASAARKTTRPIESVSGGM